MTEMEVRRILDDRLKLLGGILAGVIALFAGAIGWALSIAAANAVSNEIEAAETRTEALATALFALLDAKDLPSSEGTTPAQIDRLMRTLERVRENNDLRKQLNEFGVLKPVINSSVLALASADLREELSQLEEMFPAQIRRDADACDTLMHHYGRVAVFAAADPVAQRSDIVRSTSKERYNRYSSCGRKVFPESVAFNDAILWLNEKPMGSTELPLRYLSAIETLSSTDRAAFDSRIVAILSGGMFNEQGAGANRYVSLTSDLADAMVARGLYREEIKEVIEGGGL